MLFDSLLSIVDDAVALAKEAVAVAETASAQPAITLTKVANSRYEQAAAVIHKAGALREYSRDELVNTLATAGETGHLEIMEKLASSAVFPLDDITESSGDLVEKRGETKRYDGLTPKQALWRRALDEAEEEFG